MGLKSKVTYQESNETDNVSRILTGVSHGKSYPNTSQSASSVPKVDCSGVQSRQEGLFSILNLFKKMGTGYFLLAQFQCRSALQMFESIPMAQRDTAWVLSKIARAHFELGSYSEPAEAFAKVRDVAHASVEDMDIYSTTLWHLKREVDLLSSLTSS